MPYKRKTYGKKRARKPTNSKLNYLVKKVERLDSIDNCVKREAAQVNVPSIIDAPDTQPISSLGTGMIRDWTNIDEALDSTQARLRQKIQLKRFFCRYQLRVGVNSSIEELQRTVCKVRVMMVFMKTLPYNVLNRDVAPYGNYPYLGNVLAVNSICSHMDILASQTWVNRSHFKILYNKVHNLDPMWRDINRTIPNQQGDSHAFAQFSLDLSKLPITEFNPSDDGQYAVTKGRLFMVAFSDNINANTNPVILEYDGVLNYDN